MSLIFRDFYLKNNQQIQTRKLQWLGIIRSYGELTRKLNFGDYIIEPYDSNRDVIQGTQNYQRLQITINHVEPENSKTWDPELINNEICSLLCLASGRKIVNKSEFLLKINNQNKFYPKENKSIKYHRNLLAIIETQETQQILNKIWGSFQKIKTQDSYEKLCTLIKAIHLYQSSLEIIEDNYEAAYVLLIASAETIAKQFSSISPTREDLPQSKKIAEFFVKHELDSNLEQELLNILFQPAHVKLRAKFVDVILSNLDSDFFEKPPMIYVITGKDFKNDGQFTFTGWNKHPDNNWNFQKNEINKLLKNIYDCRSQFVHSGEEFPHWSKHVVISSGLAPIKTDKHGKARKDEQGNYYTEKKIIPYFTFERMMNNVLINLFDKL